MVTTYVLIKTLRGHTTRAIDELRKFSEIELSAQVTGKYDLVIRIKNSDPEQIDNILTKIRTIDGVTAANTFTPELWPRRWTH
ncbi:MAG TPA: Lrp/AsnC ligand binding domain-containing protein [Candidatus Acidoferrum sp.]|nr:Lrp/AsnC ligand binding domain-containing protein [Candidatus Acidoferrum sp.]